MKTRMLISVIMMVFLSSFSPQPGIPRLPYPAEATQGEPKAPKVTGRVTSANDGLALAGVNVSLKNTATHTRTDKDGRYFIRVPEKGGVLQFSLGGRSTLDVQINGRTTIDVALVLEAKPSPELIFKRQTGQPSKQKIQSMAFGGAYETNDLGDFEHRSPWNTEEYDAIHENIFHSALQNPLSTFSIDVDAASYSNIRRFIHNGQRPPMDAVRIEEMVNYFDYDYLQPKGEDPFSIYAEVSTAPWNEKHRLVHIGLQGKDIPTENLPATNLVFLIDVSGSMNEPNKLPLLKSSLRLLVEQLREQDRIAMVVYAGAAGMVLPSTSGGDKKNNSCRP